MKKSVLILLPLLILVSGCSPARFAAVNWVARGDVRSIHRSDEITKEYEATEAQDSRGYSRGYIELKFSGNFRYRLVTQLQLCFSKLFFSEKTGKVSRSKSIRIDLRDQLKKNEWYYDFDEIVTKFAKEDISIDDNSVFAVVPLVRYNNALDFYAAPNYARLNFKQKIIEIIEEGGVEEEGVEDAKIRKIPELDDIQLVEEREKRIVEYLECLLSEDFSRKIEIAPDSKIYKIKKIFQEPVNPSTYFETAKFGVDEKFTTLVKKIETASRKSRFKEWIDEKDVAFLFEGWASPPEINEASRISAELNTSVYYKWDAISNCLVERTARYRGEIIKNKDLPILRACKTGQYFAQELKNSIDDIDSRIFPVAKEIYPLGPDDQEQRVVNLYVIARPQIAQIN